MFQQMVLKTVKTFLILNYAWQEVLNYVQIYTLHNHSVLLLELLRNHISLRESDKFYCLYEGLISNA